MSLHSQTIHEVQIEFEKVVLESLKTAIHQISLDSYSIPATKFLQVLNFDPNNLSADLLNYLMYQQMVWEEMNKIKSQFYPLLPKYGKTAPNANSKPEEKRAFGQFCDSQGFIAEISKVMKRFASYPSPPVEIFSDPRPSMKSVRHYIMLRDSQLTGTKYQFLEELGNRWGISAEAFDKVTFQHFSDLENNEVELNSVDKQEGNNRNKIQQLLEFPDQWQELLASLQPSDLKELEETVITGSLLDTANKLLSISNRTKKNLPDFPLFKTFFQLFGRTVKKERSEEQRYYEDFLYAIWKESFVNTILTLRESGIEQAREVWKQMYEGLDFNIDMLIKTAEETSILEKLDSVDLEKTSLDDIRNQFMDQFLRDEIPGVIKAVKGFLATVKKEDNQSVKLEIARAFRMTESSVSITKQGQLAALAKTVADGMELTSADFNWIRLHEEDIVSALDAIEQLRMVSLNEAVLTLEKIDKLDSVQSRWNNLTRDLKEKAPDGKKDLEGTHQNHNFKDESGFDFFGDLTGSLDDDLGNLNLDALDKE